LSEATQYLKPNVIFEQLDVIAHAMSDDEAADRLNQARAELLQSTNNAQASAA
jgi:hypothetical protein